MPKPLAIRRLQLTIVVEQPVYGVAYALQRGRRDVELIQVGASEALHFTFEVEQKSTSIGTFDVRGPHVQGTRGNRFAYIGSGTFAGQDASCWSRRAKVSLSGIPESPDGSRYQARFLGTAGDGGPTCASVRLLGGGWINCSWTVAPLEVPN